MKVIFTFIIFVIISIKVQSQNLVPNYSFEVHDSCPTWSALLKYAVPWFDPVPFLGGSDYFNSCAAPPPPDVSASVPFNTFGFQYARTGNAYAGLIAYYIVSDYREYIEVELLDSLRKGKHYCGGFYVNNPECLYAVIHAVDRLGIHFSKDSVRQTTPPFWTVIPVIPQIESTAGNIIYDTLNWVLISGIVKSIGGERFITIGNFRNDSQTAHDTLVYPRPSFCSPNGFANAAYYFIDDVFVEEMQIDTANAGTDNIICEGDSIQLGVAAGSGCIYTWQPATGLSDTTIAQPLAFPTQTTTYILTVHDTGTGTICDWTSTDTVTVFVDPPCPPPPPPEQPIEIYNIFTPNNDLKNDVFYIKNLPANSSLQIFNRWGSRVYQSSNYSNQWNGGGAPDGTYYYILVLPSKESYHGFVELRR